MKRVFFILTIFIIFISCSKSNKSEIENQESLNTTPKVQDYENDIEEYESTDSISQDSDE